MKKSFSRVDFSYLERLREHTSRLITYAAISFAQPCPAIRP